MSITIAELVAWLIAGGLAGSLVGMVVKRQKEGFGHWINLGIGMVGALCDQVMKRDVAAVTAVQCMW